MPKIMIRQNILLSVIDIKTEILKFKLKMIVIFKLKNVILRLDKNLVYIKKQ